MKHVESFLKKIGLKADQIAKLSSEDEINLDEMAKSFKDSFREVIANDPDFIQPIKDEIKGSELSKIEHKIKKAFSLSSEEIKEKKFDEIIQIAFEKTKSSSSAGTEELQAKMIELSKENKRLLEEIIPAKEAEAKETIKSFKKDTSIRSLLSSKPLIVSPDVILPAIQNHLNQNYSIDLDDQGGFIVKTKSGLNPLNEDGTKVIGFDEILESQLKSLGVLKQSNGNPAPGNSAPKSILEKKDGEAPRFNLPGMKTAEANAEAMKKIRTFGQ